MCVWGAGCATQIARLQKVQNFAVRIVANLRRHDHITATLNELGWPTVERMIAAADVALINQLMTNREDAPAALKGCARSKGCIVHRSQVTSRSSRSSAAVAAPLLQLPRVRTELAHRSFRFRAMNQWNGQDAAIRCRYAADVP